MKQFLHYNLKPLIILLLSVLLFNACGIIRPFSKHDNRAKGETTVDTLNKYYPDSTYVYKTDSSKTNTEFIDWSSARINGKLPLESNTKDLYRLLGQPDSIVTPNYDDVSVRFYDEKEFKNAYFKGSDFEIYGDTAVVCILNFEKNPDLEFTSGSLILNHNTTLADLKKVFPKAVRARSKNNNWGFGKCTEINLATWKYYNDDSWLLFFQKGRLIRIDHWMPD